MKVLPIAEAQARLDAVCEEALAGEIIRLQVASGALLELTPVPGKLRTASLSDQQLAEGYDDADCAAFENHCGKSSD